MSSFGSHPPPPPPLDGGGSAPDDPTLRRRDPVAILLWNLFGFGGIGYLLIGQKHKAIAAFVLWVVLAIPTCLAGALAISIVFAIDGFMQAGALTQGHTVGDWTIFNQHL